MRKTRSEMTGFLLVGGKKGGKTGINNFFKVFLDLIKEKSPILITK